MFIRFTMPFLDLFTRRPLGVFHGAWWVCRDRLDLGDRAWLDQELGWFNDNLPVPGVPVDPRAVFWFRPDAGAPLSRMWSLARVVEASGIPIHVYRTRRPGIVVYQDDHQIAARPWRDSFDTRTRSH